MTQSLFSKIHTRDTLNSEIFIKLLLQYTRLKYHFLNRYFIRTGMVPSGGVLAFRSEPKVTILSPPSVAGFKNQLLTVHVGAAL